MARQSSRQTAALTADLELYYVTLGLVANSLDPTGSSRRRNEKPRAAGSVSRRFRNDDSPHVEAPASPWLRPRATNQTNLKRFAADRRRIALPSSAAPSQSRACEGRMGHLLHKPACPDLPGDGGRRKAFRARGIEVRAHARGDHAGSGAG